MDQIDLPPDLRDRLLAAFAPLDVVVPGVRDLALAVITDDLPESRARLAALCKTSPALIAVVSSKHNQGFARLVPDLATQPPLLVRFGRVLALTSGALSSDPQGPGQHPWLEALLVILAHWDGRKTQPPTLLTIHRALLAAGEDPRGWLRRIATSRAGILMVEMAIPDWGMIRTTIKPTGLADLLTAAPECLPMLLAETPPEHAANVADLLVEAGCPPRRAPGTVRAWLVSPAKRQRDAADRWLMAREPVDRERSEDNLKLLTELAAAGGPRRELALLAAAAARHAPPPLAAPVVLPATLAKAVARDPGMADAPPTAVLGKVLALWSFVFGRISLSDVRIACAALPATLAEAIGLATPSAAWTSYETTHRRTNALTVLRGWSPLPDELLPLAWQAAFGSATELRDVVRPLLAGAPEHGPRLLAALADRQQAVRLAAADWVRQLGRAAPAGSAEALLAALAKERSDGPRAALMLALEAAGASTDAFIDRDALRTEAWQGLGKATAAGRGAPDWLPLDQLPALRWHDADSDLDPLIPRWWIVQALRLAKAEPTPLLVHFARLLDPARAALLARWLLSRWVARDLGAAHGPQAAAPVADLVGRSDARSDIYTGPPQTATAMAEKGLLAVVAACADGRVVPEALAYINGLYGFRAGQCRALVRMLAWVRDPAATNAVLAISRRFRTRTIREEAEAAMRDLATRRGWTLDELADRCVPDGGLDAGGRRSFAAGGRIVTASVDATLRPHLHDADGGKLKAPPTGGDPEEAKAAAYAWKEVKDTAKTVLAQQRQRLYEAMCARRTWRAADWREHLLGHPLMTRLSASLVWIDGDGATFRPQDDGTLVGNDDRSVELSADARLGLVHAIDLTPAQRAAWGQHLADYAITPLFDQLRREPLTLPPERAAATALDDRLGWAMPYPKLRGAALGAAHTRGPVGDGPSFFQWRRTWSGLDLVSEITFSGMGLPETGDEVALATCTFHRPATVDAGQPLPLAAVPPVVLSECWHAYRAIGDLGAFDPAWAKQLK